MESSSASKPATPAKATAPKETEAEAPGPISPEHESGSWEQTKAVEEAREKMREAQGAKAK